MLRKNLFLLSSFLLFSSGLASKREEKQVAPPTSTMPNSLDHSIVPTISSDFLPLISKCAPITEGFIRDFCISDSLISSADADKIARTIIDIRNSDRVVGNYIDAVFNYLPDFKIEIFPSIEEAKKIFPSHPDSGVYYYGEENKLILTTSTNMALIRLGLRHAFMHALQISHAQSAVNSVECYFPNTPSEREKIATYLQEGDKKVSEMRDLLEKEEKKQLTEKEKLYLSNLRAPVKAIYEKFYMNAYSIYLSITAQQAEKLIGKKINLTGHGDVHVLSYKVINDKVQVRAQILDPLRGMVTYHQQFMLALKKEYPERTWLYEQDAYLFSGIPTFLLKELYANYYAYTNKLLERITFPTQFQLPSPHYSFIYPHDLQTTMFLTNPERIDSNNAGGVIDIIRKNILKKNKWNECQMAANILINKKLKVGEANVCLAGIAYQQKNYPVACEHYQIAAEKGVKTSLDEQMFYIESLLKTGQFIIAEKIFKTIDIKKMTTSEQQQKYELLLADLERNKNTSHVPQTPSNKRIF